MECSIRQRWSTEKGEKGKGGKGDDGLRPLVFGLWSLVLVLRPKAKDHLPVPLFPFSPFPCSPFIEAWGRPRAVQSICDNGLRTCQWRQRQRAPPIQIYVESSWRVGRISYK